MSQIEEIKTLSIRVKRQCNRYTICPDQDNVQCPDKDNVLEKVNNFQNAFSVIKIDDEEYVVVKGSVPKSLKLRLKVICVQKELKISAVMEDLIKRWIQADAPVPESSPDFFDEDLEDVKGYVPKSLKLEFKTLCTLKRVKMRSVLFQLIYEWVQVQ